MNTSLSVDFSETSTQTPTRPLTLSRIVTHHFLAAKIRDPREEGFLDMLAINIFPLYSVLSFVSVLSFLIIAGFIAQGVYGGVAGPEFLQPGPSILFEVMAASFRTTIDQKWLFQLLTCQFVQNDFMSLISNLFLLIFVGSWAEAILTTFRTVIAFFLSVLCANAIVVCHLPLGVQIGGLTTGIYGIVGAALGALILNWPNLYFMKFPRIFVFWMFSMLIGFTFVYLRSDTEVTCALIGLFVGILVGLFCGPTDGISEKESRHLNSIQKVVLCFGFLSYFVTLIVILCLILIK
jgi:membrane associated rhomboid family serine protease